MSPSSASCAVTPSSGSKASPTVMVRSLAVMTGAALIVPAARGRIFSVVNECGVTVTVGVAASNVTLLSTGVTLSWFSNVFSALIAASMVCTSATRPDRSCPKFNFSVRPSARSRLTMITRRLPSSSLETKADRAVAPLPNVGVEPSVEVSTLSPMPLPSICRAYALGVRKNPNRPSPVTVLAPSSGTA